jgi:NADH-quinone oxidoreductase subunit K
MHLVLPLVLAALLFSVGVYGLLVRRNAVLVLMSVELMLNAVNLMLVAFDVWLRDTLHAGQSLALFVIVIAAAEVGLGLAIILQVFRLRATVAVDELTVLHEPDVEPASRRPEPEPRPTVGPGPVAGQAEPRPAADRAADRAAADRSLGAAP